jgi:hypothetical protein
MNDQTSAGPEAWLPFLFGAAMMTKETLRMIVLGAALSAVSLTGMARAADDPAKPATPAAAPTPPARPQFNPADMLKNYRDQFEGLNLSDDQMKKIDGFIATAEAEVAKTPAPAAPDANAQPGQGRRGGGGGAAFQAIRKLNEDVQSILTDTQKAALRAKQVAARVDRTLATYTAANLMLTDDQKTKVTAIIEDAKKEAVAFTPSGDRQADGQKQREMRTAMTEKLNAVLTPDQQKLIPAFGRGANGGRRGGAGGAAAPATSTPPPAPKPNN